MWHETRLKLPQVTQLASAIGLSLIFTLYLAPSKYFTADLLAAVLLVIALGAFGLRRSGVMGGIKLLAPLLVMLLYVIGFAAVNQQSSNLLYASELIAGFLPFLLLYVVFRAATYSGLKILIVGVFILPGLIHLGYMWFDIFSAFVDGEILFRTSSKQGLLEEVKNVPRVGRRYLSIVLVHMLFGCALIMKMSRHALWKKVAYGLGVLAVLSLGVLDARAAYVSIGLGGVLLMLFFVRCVVPFLREIIGGASLLIKLISLAVMISMACMAYSAGKSRWNAMFYSFQAAITDVSSGNRDVSERPFVDKMFWDQPIADPRKCYLEGQFRCRVDQSAYLRLAWFVEGVKSIVNHPFGIGYSNNYMGRLWGVEGDEDKFQRIDSSFAEHVVCFGIVGVFLYAYFGWTVAASARSAFNSTKEFWSQIVILVVMLIFVSGVRGMFDLITEGAWRYLMALIGLYYGMLHSISYGDALSNSSC